MGYGDEIMASGEAARLYAARPVPVLILDRDGRPRTHPLWNGNAKITADRRSAHQVLINGSGARPYVDYARTTPERWAYTAWAATPGEIVLTAAERDLARPVVLVEPHTKDRASPNKRWPFERWQAVVDARPGWPWAQFSYGRRLLAGVEPIACGSFRRALGVLSGALAYAGPEGGLHHAAAALGVPAVVVFGAHCLPANTGYAAHRNIWRDIPEAVGWRVENRAAQAAMASIAPEEVVDALDAILARPETRA